MEKKDERPKLKCKSNHDYKTPLSFHSRLNQ